MEDKTIHENFQLTVTMAVACNLLWWAAGALVSGVVSSTMGGAGLTAKTAVDLPAAYAVSFLAVFPLIGRILHIPLRSVWLGGRFDAKGLIRYVPAMYTFAAVGVFLLDYPLYRLLGRGKEMSSLVPATPLYDRSGPLWCTAALVLCTVVDRASGGGSVFPGLYARRSGTLWERFCRRYIVTVFCSRTQESFSICFDLPDWLGAGVCHAENGEHQNFFRPSCH